MIDDIDAGTEPKPDFHFEESINDKKALMHTILKNM
jgi:hypothetical protein